MNSIEQCIIERASHEQELEMTLKKLSERQLLINSEGSREGNKIVALGEATSSRDSCLIALQTKQTELEKYTALNDRTSDYKILQSSKDETLVLLALKTILPNGEETATLEKGELDKIEMHDDLEYVKSLEKEVDELESEKADFSNIYDLLLEECVSKDVICSYLHSLSDLNAHTGLQCLYLHKVKECECLAQKLSKQTESVNKEDLKAQMQDKNIAISELKKLIEMFKRKSVDTNFEQPSILGKSPVQSIRNQPVVRQPTAYKSERYQCPQQRFASQVDVSNKLTKPATPHSWHQMKESSLAKPNDLIAPGPSRNCPKHVSHQSPREKVGSNDMVHNYYLEKAKKSAQLQKDKDVNGKPSMIDPARLPNTANGCKPKPRNWQASMSSRVSNKDVHLGEHRKQKPFLKFNELQCPTCKKCLYSANHDECVLEYLSRLNPRASAQNKDAKSHKTTKRYMPVEKSSASKKPERQIPTGHRFSNKKTTTVPEKTMNPRSCLRWKPTGRIFSNVRLRWIPTGKLLNSCTGKVDSEPTHVSIVDIPHIHASKQTLGLSAGTSFNGQKQQRIDPKCNALYNEKQDKSSSVVLLNFLISLRNQCQNGFTKDEIFSNDV
ncbi:hypothetical protein Tco_0626163 [Tanacetum coccineum]|uniref:Kinesin-like protein n=1 Tax=Tanacetum coccineum TaxID=301880 RepID=A0ABQ4WJL7_9ASTR